MEELIGRETLDPPGPPPGGRDQLGPQQQLSHPAGLLTNTAAPCWLEEGGSLAASLVFLLLKVIRPGQIR